MILIEIPIYINPLEPNITDYIDGEIPLDRCSFSNVYFAKMFTGVREETNLGSDRKKIVATRIYFEGDSFLSPLKIKDVVEKFKELDRKFLIVN